MSKSCSCSDWVLGRGKTVSGCPRRKVQFTGAGRSRHTERTLGARWRSRSRCVSPPPYPQIRRRPGRRVETLSKLTFRTDIKKIPVSTLAFLRGVFHKGSRAPRFLNLGFHPSCWERSLPGTRNRQLHIDLSPAKTRGSITPR